MHVGGHLIAFAKFERQVVGLLLGSLAGEARCHDQPRPVLFRELVGFFRIGLDPFERQERIPRRRGVDHVGKPNHSARGDHRDGPNRPVTHCRLLAEIASLYPFHAAWAGSLADAPERFQSGKGHFRGGERVDQRGEPRIRPSTTRSATARTNSPTRSARPGNSTGAYRSDVPRSVPGRSASEVSTRTCKERPTRLSK